MDGSRDLRVKRLLCCCSIDGGTTDAIAMSLELQMKIFEMEATNSGRKDTSTKRECSV